MYNGIAGKRMPARRGGGGMDITGRTKEMTLVGKPLTICNQRHMGWTHPYDDQTPPKQTLSEAGCGIFSIVHAIQ